MAPQGKYILPVGTPLSFSKLFFTLKHDLSCQVGKTDLSTNFPFRNPKNKFSVLKNGLEGGNEEFLILNGR